MRHIYHFSAITTSIEGPALDGIFTSETAITTEAVYHGFRRQLAESMECHEEEVIVQSLTLLHTLPGGAVMEMQ